MSSDRMIKSEDLFKRMREAVSSVTPFSDSTGGDPLALVPHAPVEVTIRVNGVEQTIIISPPKLSAYIRATGTIVKLLVRLNDSHPEILQAFKGEEAPEDASVEFAMASPMVRALCDLFYKEPELVIALAACFMPKPFSTPEDFDNIDPDCALTCILILAWLIDMKKLIASFQAAREPFKAVIARAKTGERSSVASS